MPPDEALILAAAAWLPRRAEVTVRSPVRLSFSTAAGPMLRLAGRGWLGETVRLASRVPLVLLRR